MAELTAVLPSSMRALVLVVVAACGGGGGEEGPAAAIASVSCDRIGPDGTGFLVDTEYRVALEVGQAFVVELQFPTTAAVVHRNDIYNCASWSNTGTSGVDQGCKRVAGQDGSQRLSHSLAIEYAAPVPPPVSVMIVAKPLTAPGSTTTVGSTDADTVSCE